MPKAKSMRPVSARWRYTSSSRTELLQERIAESRQLPFQTLGAIAVLAGPRLRSVLIATLPAIVRILDLDQLEVLLPIGPLFLQRTRTVANLNPTGRAVWTEPGLLHVA